MCRAWVFEAWPLGGFSGGGTVVYLRTVGADASTVRNGFTFSFGKGDVKLAARNATLLSEQLVQVVTPPVPPSVGALPRTARVYFSCFQFERVQQVALGRHVATFAFWNERPRRLPHCFDAAMCDRPPALLDHVAGIAVRSRSPARLGMLMPRALPPGGKCQDWKALRAARYPMECQRVAGHLAAKWEGIVRNSKRSRYAGCTLWRTRRSPVARVIYYENTAAGGGCDIIRDGGHCICLGAAAATPLQSACGRSLSALFGYRKDLAHATSALRDPCESTLTQAGWYRARARPCLVKVLNSIPLPMMHEFELPGAIGYHNVTTVDPTAPFTLDIVLAVHSSPVAELLDAMASALDTQVQATVWIYQKGQLTSQERKRLNAFQRLQVKWKRLENVGRCDHSYLTHIARRYDTLPALTLFLKDTTFAHVHVGYASKLLTFLRRLPAPVDFWGARPLGRAKPDWEMKKYGSDLCRNDFIKKKRHGRTCYKSDSNYIRAGMLLGAWRSQMGLPNGSTYKFVPGGIFAASREAIRRTPLPVYERLQKEVSRGANLEAGHFMERSWFATFNGAQRHRRISWLRSSLAVYTIELDINRAVEPAPCNRSFDNLTAHRSQIECIFFTSYQNRLLLAAARARGWDARPILNAAVAHKLKRAPHLHDVLASFDYSAYFSSASGLTLNVPIVLEAIGGSTLTTSGASMAVLPSPGSNAHSVSTAAIVRRHTSAVAEINEMWLNASSPLLLANWPTAENDDYSLQTLLEDPRWTGRRLTAVLPRDDDEAGGPSSMLILPERLAVWWSWWTCEAKGHGTIDLGRARQSHCCKPGDLESHARGAAL